jgi:hypothetical protein
MTRRQASAGMLASVALAAAPAVAMAQEPKARQLPPPHQDGGMPLMAALKLRHSTREYRPKLPPRRFMATRESAVGPIQLGRSCMPAKSGTRR